jgi:hypothetical protein
MAETNEELAIRRALATMTAGQPPAPPGRYSAVRHRVVVNRRRRLASVALAVAILVMAAIAIPLGWLRVSPPPPAAPRYHVTLLPPPSGSRHSVVATGRIDGLRWEATVTLMSGDACPGAVFGQGPGASGGCNASGPPAGVSTTGYPLGYLQGTGTGLQVDIAAVRADITKVEISYSNGQVLTSRAVAVFSSRFARYIAFAAPYDSAITRITAFSRRGPVAYTVPFTASAEAGIYVVRWLRPDQAALPRPARYLAGTGVIDGRRWRDHVYVGPWGTCFVHPQDESGQSAFSCFPRVEWLQGHPQVAAVIGVAYQGNLGYFYGQAEPAVRYLVVTTAHGHTGRVVARSAGGRRFFVFASKDGDPATRWAAYDAAGNQLASGPVPLSLR